MFKPDLVSLDVIKEQPIDWLWPGVLALGKLTLLAGDPGLGKSFVTMDLTSRMTTGEPFPFTKDRRDPAEVLLISAEDDPADTIKPRIRMSNGDASRIHILTGVTDGQKWDDFNIEEHIWPLTVALAENPATKLIVIDPISAYMPRSDSNNNTQVRTILKRLSDLAASRHVAMVCVTHLRKSGKSSPAVHNLIGSLAFTAAARAVWMVQRLKAQAGDAEDNLRGLRPVKCNIANDRDGFVYRIADGRVEWVERRAFDESEETPTTSRATVFNEIAERLKVWLANGPVEVEELRRLAANEGFNWLTVRFVKKEMNITGEGASTVRRWSLPQSEHMR